MMPINRVNPVGSPSPRNYHHSVAASGKTVYTAGQVAYDENREVIGRGDVVAQTRQALANLERALSANGADLTQVVKITTFVVNYDRPQMEGILGAIGDFFAAEHLPANSLIGVEKLATKDLLVEIEAIAVID